MIDREKLAARLRATFVVELEEHVRTINAEALALERAPNDGESLQALFRAAHTLKGAARAAGVELIEHVCHALESRLADARSGEHPLAPGDFTLVFATADALARGRAALHVGETLDSSGLSEVLAALSGTGPLPKRERQPPAPERPTPTEAAPPSASLPADSHMRVDAEKLDDLLGAASEVTVAQERLARRADAAEELRRLTDRWASAWRRLGRDVRLALDRAHVDPMLAERVRLIEEDAKAIDRAAGRLAAGISDDARAVAQSSGEVMRRTHQVRLRPFGDACEALPRAARDVATTAGKEVKLEVSGSELELDRAVLDGLRDALLPLVRNAVDHGIEPPAAREGNGKPRSGTVRVGATMRGGHVEVTVTDDGTGLDLPALRAALAARGREASPDDATLVREVLAASLSTRSETTAISGRGVGLDIVREAVRRIRGSIDVTWTAGRGTTFSITCPRTLVTVRVVVVRVGPHTFALPTAGVERMERIPVERLREAQGRPVLPHDAGPIPIVSLARVLGPPLIEQPAPHVLPVVILRAEGRRLAAVVDELLEEREVLLRPVPSATRPLPFIAGAALVNADTVAPILDFHTVVAAGVDGPGGDVRVAEAESVEGKRRLLVVDDSITTRTLEASVLETAGYEVLTAVDGADAWRVLQEHAVDLVVADVEMPRMDGFALCETIRASVRRKEVPVILVTALETPEHRQRGMEVGADAYLGKSSFDQQQLLETIHQLLGDA